MHSLAQGPGMDFEREWMATSPPYFSERACIEQLEKEKGKQELNHSQCMLLIHAEGITTFFNQNAYVRDYRYDDRCKPEASQEGG